MTKRDHSGDPSGDLLAKFLRARAEARTLEAKAPTRYLGPGAVAKALGLDEAQTSGHWCSRCQAMWFGGLSEVTCPACGSRQG